MIYFVLVVVYVKEIILENVKKKYVGYGDFVEGNLIVFNWKVGLVNYKGR